MKKRIVLICCVVFLLVAAITPSIASAMSVGFSTATTAAATVAPKVQTTSTAPSVPADFEPTTSTVSAGTMTTAKSMSAASATTNNNEPEAVTDDVNAADAGMAITVSKYGEYLVSEREISFTDGDSVSRKAAELTAGKKTTEAKVVAIFNYIVKNFRYNYDLYNQVKSGQVTTYTPNPVKILASGKGICYDISSLLAAMCRSQGIPCKMVKGYAKPVGGGYHAWNSIYDLEDNRWVSLDATVRMGKSTSSSYVEIKSSDYTIRSET